MWLKVQEIICSSFWFPNECFQFNQESLVSHSVTQPPLGCSATHPVHEDSILPATSNNVNITAQKWLAGPARRQWHPPRSPIPALTLSSRLHSYRTMFPQQESFTQPFASLWLVSSLQLPHLAKGFLLERNPDSTSNGHILLWSISIELKI